MRHTTFPLLVIGFGAAWLAHESGWFGEWHKLLPIALIVIGIAIPLTEGINRHSIVAGPMLVYCGAIWLAYLHDQVAQRLVLPLGVVVWGVLLLVSRTWLPDSRRRRRLRDAPPSDRPPGPSP